jgi:hypothetical protein
LNANATPMKISAQTSTETKVVVCGTPICVLVLRVIADV